MSDTTETRWFKIIIFIVTGFVLGVSIANIVYYNRIKSGTCNAVTSGEANAMFWINIIIAVAVGLVMLWSLWRLLFSREFREQLGSGVTGYLQGEGSGLVGPRTRATSGSLASNVVNTGL